LQVLTDRYNHFPRETSLSTCRKAAGMRAVVLRGPGNYELADVLEPEPGPGEVLVAVEACGVCGSDVHLVDGSTVGRYPVVLGHEAAGRVVSCGPGVHGVTEGVRVAVLPYVGCGACRLCSLGQ